MEGDTLSLQDNFEFDYGDAKETGGKLTGELRPTGIRPMFSTRLADRGIPLPAALFGVPDLDFMSAGGRR
jgi:pilus assembly protein CpaF